MSGRKDASIALAIVVLPDPCTPVTTIHAGGARRRSGAWSGAALECGLKLLQTLERSLHDDTAVKKS